MIGLSIRTLADATLRIQNRALSDHNIRDTYLKPLLNENFINTCKSQIDGRAYISFPLIKPEKIQNYTIGSYMCISDNIERLKIINSTLFPSKQYLNIWFSGFWKNKKIDILKLK
jgi:hypothetical protein